MAIVITNQGHVITTTTGTSTALAIASNITVGSSIVVAVAEDNGTGALGTLADDASNSYALLSQASPNNAVANGRDSLWVCHNCNALNAGQNITYTKAVTTVACIVSAGSIIGGPFLTDQVATPTTGNTRGTLVSVGTLSTSNQAAFGYIGEANAAADAFTQVSGWAVPFDNLTRSGGGVAQRGGSIVVSSNSALTYNPDIGASRPWSAHLATFKIAAVTTQKSTTITSPENLTKILQIVKSSFVSLLPEIITTAAVVTAQRIVSALSHQQMFIIKKKLAQSLVTAVDPQQISVIRSASDTEVFADPQLMLMQIGPKKVPTFPDPQQLSVQRSPTKTVVSPEPQKLSVKRDSGRTVVSLDPQQLSMRESSVRNVIIPEPQQIVLGLSSKKTTIQQFPEKMSAAKSINKVIIV